MYRLKHSFTSGELSPLMDDRIDFDRFKNGTKKLENALCLTQGPASRRPGMQFIHDLNSLGLDTANPVVRTVPFIFNELQAYVMIFFMHTDGQARIVWATTTTNGDAGLVLGSGVAHDYDFNYEAAYVDAGDYVFGYPSYDTIISTYGEHIADDGTITPLAETTDYTIAYADGLATVTVTNATLPDNDGTLYITLEMQTTAIAVDQVVTMILPATWDVENFDWAQSADELYIAQTGLTPHVIQRFADDNWVLVEKTFTDQPAEWSEEGGWPERVTFHQQRLVFAANKVRRQTVWMTEAGDFNSFAKSSPLVDSDSVSFTLDSGTQNKIIWMVSGKSLNIGTIGNEWTVVGGTQTALTPTNILAQKQTNNGGSSNKPLTVGITTLFIERHGRTINEFVFNYNVDSYESTDLAILAPHMTEEYSITDWTYQQTPDSVIWCIREDGQMLGLTYQRQHKVVGWHRHTTDGEFKTVTAIPGDTREDDVWSIVKRDIDGSEMYYVEKMYDMLRPKIAEDGRYLDSFLVYDGTPTQTVTGLEHLEGKEVNILADGTVHPPLTVVSGQIELNNTYSLIVVGLQYITEIRPLLVDAGLKDGTSLGRSQRITNLNIDFYDSLGCVYGKDDSEDGEKTEELPFRTPGNLLGNQVPLFTGFRKISFREGFDNKSEYFIRQLQPLPMHIRAVVDEVQIYD